MTSKTARNLRIIAFVAFIIGVTYSNFFGQQINTISSKCPSPNQLTKSSVKALATGDITYTPCSAGTNIFYGSIAFNGSTTTACVFCFVFTPSTTSETTGLFEVGNTTSTLGAQLRIDDNNVTSQLRARTTNFTVQGEENSFQFNSTNNLAYFELQAIQDYHLQRTVTAAGTTGNQVINKPNGSVNFPAAGGTLTVTNSLVTTSSTIFVTYNVTGGSKDATCTSFGVTNQAAGSFRIVPNANCTAETRVSFLVLN
jgi:hypothetical protein